MFEKAVAFFMPSSLRGRPAQPRYHEFRVLISTCLIGLPLMLLFPIPVYYMHRNVTGYLINDLMVVCTLFCCRYFGHYRIPMTITAIATYFIIYGWIRDSGLIFSTNLIILHMFLLCAIWADKRFGWIAIPFNLGLLGFIYYQTINSPEMAHMHTTLGSASYALGMNGLVTIFFGGFLAYLQMDQERERLKFKNLQEQKIDLLDQAVKKRTQELSSIRESIASDFHDQTGNLLSAITRQAALLNQKYADVAQARPIVEGIITNSNTLYASSKDFLWHLNHQSDDPRELFDYLTCFGQQYYNNFDIAFSSALTISGNVQLPPSAALDLIYIFKEAMTNVAKHAGALEVTFAVQITGGELDFILGDNGSWKATTVQKSHYGLENMRRRCMNNNFRFNIYRTEKGTLISVCVPVNIH